MRITWWALVGVLSSGCRTPDKHDHSAILAAVPTALDFGTVAPGASAARTLVLSNKGADTITLHDFVLDGTTAISSFGVPSTQSTAAFQIAKPGNLSLGRGASLTVTITYAPTSEGSDSVRLLVLSDADNDSSLAVSLTGKAALQRAPGTLATAVAAGLNYSCAVTKAGGLKCWGYNGEGQLGDGTKKSRGIPQNVSGLTADVANVSAGDHGCAITTAGAVYCWGPGDNGQLGNNSWAESDAPVAVAGLSAGAQSVSAGLGHSCAITATGSAQCWGLNAAGGLGDNSQSNRPTPVDVVGLSNVAQISAGIYYTCAVTHSGAVKCWGAGSNGQLGNGGNNDSAVPVNVAGLAGPARAVSAGAFFLTGNEESTCALLQDGTVQCWGSNSLGELGNNNTDASLTPITVAGLAGVTSFSGSVDDKCAVASGNVFCWGSNSTGQLGDGTKNDRHVPTSVSALSGATAVVTGGPHACAIVGAGVVHCWGANGFGELGDGTQQTRMTPVEVQF